MKKTTFYSFRLSVKAIEVAKRLEQLIPNPACALEYQGSPWKLLVMSRLSAQCTDARVNIVCRELFTHFPTLESLANAPLEDIEEIVKPCGLFRTKSANIRDACIMLLQEYGGVLPNDMNSLLKFPGIGRKTANLLLGEIYNVPSIAADTHCMRVSVRLGLCEKAEPLLVENTLKSLLPAELQFKFNHRAVLFGRHYCTARAPQCEGCVVADLCEFNK